MNSDKKSQKQKTTAVIGLFDEVDALMAAIPQVKAKGLGKLEAYTPYPVHGLDEALGLKRSPLGGMVLVMGVVGAATAMLFQWWMSAVDYPVITGGKAPFSWQAFVPVMFELMVLFATFTAGLGMLLLLNKLPYFGHPMLTSKAIQGITRDRFALALESDEGELDAEAAQAVLREAGAKDLEVLELPAEIRPFTADVVLRSLGGIAAACVVAGVLTYGAIKLFHVLPPMADMHDQPRLNPQEPTNFFKDGHGMQLPVEGTVARGRMPIGVASQEAAAILVNPLPRTREILDKGARLYAIRCTVCHGATGNGVPTLTSAYGAKPANLISKPFRDTPDGQLYWAIVKGKNNMPAYGPDLSEDERWAVIHYVRALQRSQNAKDEDLR
jgi:mono/diheme cytochrome c family protein